MALLVSCFPTSFPVVIKPVGEGTVDLCRSYQTLEGSSGVFLVFLLLSTAPFPTLSISPLERQDLNLKPSEVCPGHDVTLSHGIRGWMLPSMKGVKRVLDKDPSGACFARSKVSDEGLFCGFGSPLCACLFGGWVRLRSGVVPVPSRCGR